MPYRRMTEAELDTFVQEYAAFQTWRVYAAYARDIYGPAAERIEVITGSEYNDEWSYLVVEQVHVYSADCQLLEPDQSTDWWQTILQHDRDNRADAELDDDEYQDQLIDAIGERRAELPVLAGGHDTFFVSKPPRLSQRTLYAYE
jgi:hypothetical protein